VRRDDTGKPVFNPQLIIKLRAEALKDPECLRLLLEAHRFAAGSGLPIFANLSADTQHTASYSSTGFRLASDWKEDWELDTLQTGSIDTVIVNLPRIMYKASSVA